MKKIKHLRYLLLVGFVILFAGTPAAIYAADQVSEVTANIYLPIVMKPDSSGSTDILVNGGKVAGPDGVGIGALANTLDAPINVSITAALPPATAVPALAQVLSGFYQISAGEDVFVLPESPFILAFPVPVGANAANLALAVLQSGAGMRDVDEGIEAWTILEGKVDLNRSLFLTTIAGLKQEGQVFALVEHPDFESPPNDGSPSAPPANGSLSLQFDLITVHCIGFTNPTECTETTESLIAGYLADIYARIHQGLGFDGPRLRYMDETLAYDPHSYNFLGYSTYIEPKTSAGCDGNNGYYDPLTARLVLCLDPVVGIPADSVHTLIHEYFHATQYGYPEVLADYHDRSEEGWVIEGMAASAKESYFVDEMLRSDSYGGLHNVDISLEYSGGPDDLDEYRAQDFWVYHGQRNGLDLSYLEAILQRGSSSQAVANALGTGGLLDVYWDWAKNHVMEPEIDYGGLIGTPCQTETQVIALMDHFDYIFGGNNHYDIVLDPLTSLVIKINFNQPFAYVAATGDVALGDGELPEAELALRYKFYREGGEVCETIPDGRRTYQTIDEREFDYYLVVSNIDPNNTYSYRVVILDPVPYSLSAP
jgi:hypothetical protein